MENISNEQNNQRGVFYAHTPRPGSKIWHELGEHLLGTGEGAGNFAEFFGAKDIAYLLGVWHDLGKFNPKFRSYLIAQHEGFYHPSEPHAIWGAALAYKLFLHSNRWHEIALPILGHHAGLYDQGDAENKLRKFLDQYPHALNIMRNGLQNLNVKMPTFKLPEQNSFQRELFVRMIFSALVDADYLDTEKHFDPNQAKQRILPPSICSLWRTLELSQVEILNQSESTIVNRIRKQVYESCLSAAALEPGIFRLTVPTGGGKTRSGLAFALCHAFKNNLNRVIVAIPYTSITTQTAQTYRDIFGNDAILEHHSAMPLQDDKDDKQDIDYLRRKLASENWDASLIVTTTVQLFESLFSNRTSKSRKLHRLARSVIILDEVQTLPLEILAPTLDVLKTLSTPVECGGYGASIVLCTATQPAFEESHWLAAFQGAKIREIVPDYSHHFAELAKAGRVEYSMRSAIGWKELADEVITKSQVLVVLNTRKDALTLLELLDGTADVFHLSTLLCGAHRQAVLTEIKARLDLNNPRPVRLISTQVVEAGVDIDFPEVWRAVGPLDRIVQAAGRCNREGKRETGHVVIFEPIDGKSPSGPYKVGLEKARFLLAENSPNKLHDPDFYRDYFHRLFADVDLDKKNIQAYREALNYPEVANRYRLIDSETVSVIAPYGDALTHLDDWNNLPTQRNWQRLQPYLVNLFQHEVREKQDWLKPITPGLYLWTGRYDNTLGLVEGYSDPSDLVVWR